MAAKERMPEISRFFGVIISMYYLEEMTQHHRPHFHAHYQRFHAVFFLDTLEIARGSMPDRERRFIEAWAELYRTDLERDWELLKMGKMPLKIDPLRK